MYCSSFSRVAVLPIVDSLGTGLQIVRSDINGNLTRVESKFNSDKESFAHLLDIPRAEKGAGTAMDTSSTTNALMWLTRAHVFIIALLKILSEVRWPSIIKPITSTKLPRLSNSYSCR